MSWAAVAGGAISVGGSLLSGSGGGGQAKQDALQNLIAGTAFSPIGVSMPGGGGVTFGGGAPTGGGAVGDGGSVAPGTYGQQVLDPRTGKPIISQMEDGMRALGSGKTGRAFQSDIGNIGLNLGDLEPARAGLAGFTGQQAGQLGFNPFAGFDQLGAGLAGTGLQQAAGAGQGLDLMSLLAGQQLGGAVGDISNFRNMFQDPLQQGILSSIQDASLTGEQAATRHLDLLRQQAQPFEERAFSDLNENLFGTGRIGTSGGALQTEAFARGLGQADLSRQLAASGEGRAATQQALAQATGLGGLQDSLLGNALSRFGGLTDLGARLSGQRFDQGTGLFGTGLQAAGAPAAYQAGQLGNLTSALQGLTGLTNISTVPANLALQFMQSQANTRINQASGMGGQVNAGDLSRAATGSTLADLGGAVAGSGIDFGSLFGGLFGGGGSTSQSFTPTSKGTGGLK